jgi:hypothetical protein
LLILSLSLEFARSVSEPVRSRISYAFRVYAAVYGHLVVESPAEASHRCFYGAEAPVQKDPPFFHIPARYRATKGALQKLGYAGEEFHLQYGFDLAASRPDWLGELFHWMSSGHEANIETRDDIGRIPYSASVFSRESLSPRKPHAALLMAWMENELRNSRAEALPKAPSPVSDADHLVLCTHDIDFYFVGRVSALVRLIKNLGIAARLYRSWPYFIDNLRMIFEVLRGKRIGDYLPALLSAAKQHELQSTFFVVSRRGHRRDPAYRLEQIAERLLEGAHQGHSTALHGSYRSIIEDRSLLEEARFLSHTLGRAPLAGRQHWLRFSQHGELFSEVAKASLLVDSTLGFPDMVGFRNGASFPFPPYDFCREAPHDFLEVPLVLMDGSLQSASVQLRTCAADLAEEVLGESRKVGWGGISVLWHNPIEPLSVPAEINRVFWSCARRQKLHGEKWMGVEPFLKAVLPRYQQAGLLKEVRLEDRLGHSGAATKTLDQRVD